MRALNNIIGCCVASFFIFSALPGSAQIFAPQAQAHAGALRPGVSVSPSHTPVGSVVFLSGAGFTASHTATLHVRPPGGTPALYTLSVNTDGNGSYSNLPWNAPGSVATTGTHSYWAIDNATAISSDTVSFVYDHFHLVVYNLEAKNKVDADQDGYFEKFEIWWRLSPLGPAAWGLVTTYVYQQDSQGAEQLVTQVNGIIPDNPDEAKDYKATVAATAQKDVFDYRLVFQPAHPNVLSHRVEYGQRSDLTGVPMWAGSTVTIADVGAHPGADADGDGYYESIQLNWQVAVTGAAERIYGKLYKRKSGSNESLLLTTSPYTAVPNNANDFYTDSFSLPLGFYDFRLELYREADDLLLATLSYGQDPDWRNLKLEREFEPFIETGVTFPPFGLGEVVWGDYDLDSDLDLLLVGNYNAGSSTKLYRNDPGGIFTDTPANLIGAEAGAWGDFDNDGDLDLILTGTITKLYRNDGNEVFVDLNVRFASSFSPSVDWGDYDNDGDLDIALMGLQNFLQPTTLLYRNEGEGAFSEVNAGLAGARNGTLAWGDYDNDSDLDLLVAGGYNASESTKLYRNDSGGIFTDTQAGLIAAGAGDWGDFDNDGDLDLALSGAVTKIYRNNGNGIFQDMNADLIGAGGSCEWGDYDNDGDPDILLAGSRKARVYRNEGNGTFSDIEASLIEIDNNVAGWGDYDNDSDLDLVLIGVFRENIGKLYRNESRTPNQAPAAPTRLTSSVSNEHVTLDWEAASDFETADLGLSYNLRVGKTPGGSEIMPAHAANATGYRHLPGRGNSGKRTQWTLQNLLPGTYYWSVQSVDPAFAGSAFAGEQSFVVSYPADNSPPAMPKNLRLTFSGDRKVALAWQANSDSDLLRYRIYRSTSSPARDLWLSVAAPETTYTDLSVSGNTTYFYRITALDRALNESAFSNEVSATPFAIAFFDIAADLPFFSPNGAAWGDYDNDGDLDILVGSRIYRNDGSAGFVLIAQILPGFDNDWGDYDGDGDLDVLSSSQVFRNDNGTFVDSGIPLGGTTWGDYDNDGDLDIMAGASIFRNDEGVFNRAATTLPSSVSIRSLADFDNDGDLDILASVAREFFHKIYRNDGRDNFVDIGARLRGDGSVDWGDYDQDGDLDMLVTGITGEFSQTTSIYRNDAGHFVLVRGLPDVAAGTAVWGDCDNDGDLDVLVCGRHSRPLFDVPLAEVFRNDQSGFAAAAAALQPFFESTAAWGDYDNDGDLDILLAGWQGDKMIGKIYRNDIMRPNTMPAAPANLQVIATDSSATFAWDKSTDAETRPGSLTYNLRLGATPGGNEIMAALADPANGYSRVAQLGNANHNNRWTIKNLSEGTYYWSVQALDHNFAGSTFAPEQSFHVTTCVSTGDINNDGILTPGDALCAFQIFLNNGNPPSSCDLPGFACEAIAADVNCDGTATPGDALAIFQRYLQALPPAECFARASASNASVPTSPYRISIHSGTITRATATTDLSRVNVALRVANPLGFQAFGLQLSYPNEKLEFIGVQRMALTSGWMQLEGASNTPGLITLGGFHAQPSSHSAAGELCEVIFASKGPAFELQEFKLQNLTDDLRSAVAPGDGAEAGEAGVPKLFKLYQSYPNPFRALRNADETIIRFDLPGSEDQHVEISIYNLTGQLVRRLLSGARAPGVYAVAWDGKDSRGRLLPSGVYWYRLKAGAREASKQLMMVR